MQKKKNSPANIIGIVILLCMNFIYFWGAKKKQRPKPDKIVQYPMVFQMNERTMKKAKLKQTF